MLDDGPAFQDYNTKIIKTLDDMLANGKKRSTRRSAFYCLRQMNREVDLMNPEAVKKWIGAKECSNPTKQKLANSYQYFTQSNALEWEKPVYKFDSKVPITPNKEQAEAIISSAPSLNIATIFRILLESGFEGQELRNCTDRDVDTEQGVITVAGNKGHRGRKYKFKSSTTELLRIYMHKHLREHPFPRPQVMGEAWRLARKRAAKKLGRPDLEKIPLKGLRNLSGILLWKKCRDAWIVMLHMGHKKLDTTQHYLSAMTPQQIESEWVSKAVQLGTPNTIKEIMELIDAGFRKETEADGYQIFRKPK